MPGLEPVREPIDVGVGELGFLVVHPSGRDVVAFGREARRVDYRSGVVGGRVGTAVDGLSSGAFSPDGKRLFLTAIDGRAGLWDVEQMSWLAAPDPALNFGGYDGAWSRDGSYVASPSPEAVGVWDGRTGEFLGAVPDAHGTVASTEDGLVTIADEGGVVRTWDPRPSAWVAAACRMAGRDLTEAEWRSFLPDRDYRSVCPS